jgi:hypothetical protein
MMRVLSVTRARFASVARIIPLILPRSNNR